MGRGGHLLAAGVDIRSAPTTRVRKILYGREKRDVRAKERDGEVAGEDRGREKERGREGEEERRSREDKASTSDIYAVRIRASCLSA